MQLKKQTATKKFLFIGVLAVLVTTVMAIGCNNSNENKDGSKPTEEKMDTASTRPTKVPNL